MRLSLLLIPTCAGLTRAGAATASQSSPVVREAPLAAGDSYRIAIGDSLAIAVFGEERFSQECQVNGAGTVSYSLLGDVKAAGLTCAELETRLRAALKVYLKNPQLVVSVKQYGALGMSVFVLGEVKTPGVYPLASTSGLMQAVAAAGGPASVASGEVTIIKAHSGEVHTAGLEQAMAGGPEAAPARLDPGDVIVVNRRPAPAESRRYAVLGEVPRPGMYEMPAESEARVLDAMEKAGLLDTGSSGNPGGRALKEEARGADLEHALLTRGQVTVPVSLTALLQGDTSQNLLLQADDVLTVPRRPLISVYALGEVRAPGRQQLPPDATALDLLNAVGGVTAAANLGGATLLRQDSGKPTPIALDLGRLLRQADPKQNVPLQEGDVLFVPARGERGQTVWSFLPLLPYLVRWP